MKSEHRHELQRNDLGQIALQAKPWMEQHGMTLLGGVVVVLVAIVGWLVWSSQPPADAEAWNKLNTAQTVDDFGAIADKSPDTLAGAWARLRMAELNLEEGMMKAFTDRELALKDLKRAHEEFDQVLSGKVSLPEGARQRALLGLARCMEVTCDGATEPAIEVYQKLITDFPKTIYRSSVEERIKELKTGGAKEFYAWFHKQAPKPPDFSRPRDGHGGLDLPPGMQLPPGLNFPPSPAKTGDKEPKGEGTAKPDSDKKPEGDAKPDDATKPESKPEEKKPEAPTKPEGDAQPDKKPE